MIPPAENEERPRDIFEGYDAKRVDEALRVSAGALAGIDRRKLLRDIRLERAQDSRGRPD